MTNETTDGLRAALEAHDTVSRSAIKKAVDGVLRDPAQNQTTGQISDDLAYFIHSAISAAPPMLASSISWQWRNARLSDGAWLDIQPGDIARIDIEGTEYRPVLAHPPGGGE